MLEIYHLGGGRLEDWKIKIAVLWLAFEVAAMWIPLIEHYIPGFVEEAVAQVTPESVLMLVIISMIVPLMAILSLTLRDSINRWLNIIVGIVLIVMLPIGVVGGGFPTAYVPSLIVISIVQFAAAALIVWLAWKSRQKA
jgi:threonine/homoserine/homoserine lactone efflux protein